MNMRLTKTIAYTTIMTCLSAAHSRAGCCFLWMDDGQRSGCEENIASIKACETRRAEGKWDRRHFFDAPRGGYCACESEHGKRRGNFAVCYEPDRDDLDDDGDRSEMIRWKFVVSVVRTRIVAGRCQEHHRLLRGWTDDEYS